MWSCAALLGALPLAFDHGEGADLRRSSGISIVGGLIVSYALTPYTALVVYFYIEKLAARHASPHKSAMRRGAEQ